MPNEDSPTDFALDSPSTRPTSASPPIHLNNNKNNKNNSSSSNTITSSDATAHLLTKPLPQTPLPQTPPPHPKRPPPLHQQHSRSPSLPSPLSMSLHHLGIGTPSPLLRQFSTFSPPPTWGSPPRLGISLTAAKSDHHDELLSGELSPSLPDMEPEFDADDDLTRDSKDVLVQRLGDLMRRIKGTGSVEGLEELHAKVDEMEGVLSSGKGVRLGIVRDGEVLPGLGREGVDGGSRGELLLRAVGETEDEALSSEKIDSLDLTVEVVVEAERLNAELVKLAEKLRARKEESDHIQAMLVERVEAAAAHIMELEAQIAELEDEIGGNESDLRHLRIELRAVETLCHEFVPPEADPDLVQSIENWKTDWAMLRERMSAKKKSRRLRHGEDGEGGSTILSPSISSMSILGSPLK